MVMNLELQGLSLLRIKKIQEIRLRGYTVGRSTVA
jgi:hypothetical protein